MLLFYLEWLFVIMALYWSLLKVIKNDIISIERCWYIVDHLVYSPRMWRWSLTAWSPSWSGLVFSTSVEVILTAESGMHCGASILHVCGGHPFGYFVMGLQGSYSPRMWRSSCISLSIPWVHKVFSTYVEVIPKYLAKFELVSCILHVCGGHPIGKRPARPTNKYSPRMWRSSYRLAWYVLL